MGEAHRGRHPHPEEPMDESIEASDVTFVGSEIRLQGFLTRPTGAGRFPAIVVIHEAFGLTDHIRSVARRRGAPGDVAMAVDLFSRASPAGCMARLMSGMLTS